MQVFINNAFISSSSIESVELILHNDVSLLNTYVTLPYDEAVEFCRSYNDKGRTVHAFKDGDFLIGEDVRVTHLSGHVNVPKSIIQEKAIKSVYRLYWDLAEVKALFLASPDVYDNGYVGYCSSFDRMRVSNSTMSLLISYFDPSEKNWKSKKLIEQVDGSIEQKEFFCAVRKNDVDEFLEYGLQKVKEVVINNEEFVVLHYGRNLSIYRNDCNSRFPEPVIINYFMKSLRYDCTVKLLEYALKEMRESLGFESEQIPKSKDQVKHSSVFNNNAGVFFKSTFKSVSKRDYQTIYNSLLSATKMFAEKGMVMNFDLSSIKKFLVKLGVPSICDSAAFYLLQTLIQCEGVNSKAVDTLEFILEKARLCRLSCNMYLYSIRLQTFLNPNVLDYKFGKNSFYISSDEGVVKVEVWT